MAEWTIADVKAAAPEFVTVPDATLEEFIAYAYELVNPNVFGDRTVRAGALLTAHLLTVTPPDGVNPTSTAAGPVTSKSIGPVSVSYGVPVLEGSAFQDGLANSRYGVQFAFLSRRSAVGVGLL